MILTGHSYYKWRITAAWRRMVSPVSSDSRMRSYDEPEARILGSQTLAVDSFEILNIRFPGPFVCAALVSYWVVDSASPFSIQISIPVHHIHIRTLARFRSLVPVPCLGMCTQAVVTLSTSKIALRISVLASVMSLRGGIRLLSRGSSASRICTWTQFVDNPLWH